MAARNKGANICRYAGQRIRRLIEKPWVLHPPASSAGSQSRKARPFRTGIDRWMAVSEALMDEVDRQGLSLSGERFASGHFIESLTQLPIPEAVKKMDIQHGRQLGIIDVVVTCGQGMKLGPGTSYLFKPQPLKVLDLDKEAPKFHRVPVSTSSNADKREKPLRESARLLSKPVTPPPTKLPLPSESASSSKILQAHDQSLSGPPSLQQNGMLPVLPSLPSYNASPTSQAAKTLVQLSRPYSTTNNSDQLFQNHSMNLPEGANPFAMPGELNSTLLDPALFSPSVNDETHPFNTNDQSEMSSPLTTPPPSSPESRASSPRRMQWVKLRYNSTPLASPSKKRSHSTSAFHLPKHLKEQAYQNSGFNFEETYELQAGNDIDRLDQEVSLLNLFALQGAPHWSNSNTRPATPIPQNIASSTMEKRSASLGGSSVSQAALQNYINRQVWNSLSRLNIPSLTAPTTPSSAQQQQRAETPAPQSTPSKVKDGTKKSRLSRRKGRRLTAQDSATPSEQESDGDFVPPPPRAASGSKRRRRSRTHLFTKPGKPASQIVQNLDDDFVPGDLNEGCRIGYAEPGVVRQVVSKRGGWFKEKTVLMGTRFVIW